MANELTYSGRLDQTGLDVVIDIHRSNGQLASDDLPATEVFPSIYTADMPALTKDKYLIRFFNNADNSLLGQGEIIWDGNREVTGDIEAAEIHNALDSYTNKDDWKADVSSIDLQPVLDAVSDVQNSVNNIQTSIDNLNDISLSEIEGSTILAKESKQDAIQNTANNIVSLINALNDISAEDVWTYVNRTLTSSGSITPEQDELIRRAADFAEKAAIQTEKSKRK